MDYNTFSVLHIRVDGGVAFVSIDHPPVNLLDVKLMTDVDRFISMVGPDQSIRVVVFQSADPEFFLAHGDMHFATDPKLLASVRISGDNDPALNPMPKCDAFVVEPMSDARFKFERIPNPQSRIAIQYS